MSNLKTEKSFVMRIRACNNVFKRYCMKLEKQYKRKGKESCKYKKKENRGVQKIKDEQFPGEAVRRNKVGSVAEIGDEQTSSTKSHEAKSRNLHFVSLRIISGLWF